MAPKKLTCDKCILQPMCCRQHAMRQAADAVKGALDEKVSANWVRSSNVKREALDEMRAAILCGLREKAAENCDEFREEAK